MEKEILDEWAKKSIPILKRYGYIKTNTSYIWIMTTAILGLSLVGVLFYLGYNDYFKSVINTDIRVEPAETNITNQYDINTSVNNNYQFNPNYTIINRIEIPDNLCNCP